jgi:hypothetical protein
LNATRDFEKLNDQFGLWYVRTGVAEVTWQNNQIGTHGSATLLDEAGHIAICAHQVGPVEKYDVSFCPSPNVTPKTQAVLKYVDYSHDVAILKITDRDPNFVKNNNLIPATLEESEDILNLGEEIVCVAFLDRRLNAFAQKIQSESRLLYISDNKMNIASKIISVGEIPAARGVSGGRVTNRYGNFIGIINAIDTSRPNGEYVIVFTPAFVIRKALKSALDGNASVFDMTDASPPQVIDPRHSRVDEKPLRGITRRSLFLPAAMTAN